MNSHDNSGLSSLYILAKALFAADKEEAAHNERDHTERSYDDIKFSDMNDYIHDRHSHDSKTIKR